MNDMIAIIEALLIVGAPNAIVGGCPGAPWAVLINEDMLRPVKHILASVTAEFEADMGLAAL